MSNPYAPPSSGTRGEERPGDPGAPPAPGPQTPAPHGPHGAADGSAPHEKPPRPPQDPEAVRAASRMVLHFGLLMLASLVTSSLALPWQVAALGFALAALVQGVRALRAIWRAGVRGVLVPVVASGVALTAVMSLSMLLLLALWPVQMERQDCLGGALTISAREACESRFQESLTEFLEQYGQRPTG
ncbi:hypothetical protein [Actinotalea sp. K2]|uniref:hypothetical protein n=1 Tax=Actinotalea sp. K2 TaxID=2939438 RepID=UPI0020174B9F|nr:hypothetical protein [Actinotalea sp. K2]MCL3859907.1 hypothetical protein [Actinotalea sp. K2]